MTDISVHTTAHQVEDRSWYLGTAEMPGFTVSGTLDISAFTAGTHYPDGYIKSGEPLVRLGSGLYAPYAATGGTGGDVVEASTVTITATGGTYVVAVNGRETDALAYNANAAAIQAAIRALGPEFDSVTVTGTGPFTITWTGVGDALRSPVLDVVIDDTAATGGTVVVAEGTAGAVGASGTGAGLLFSAVKVPNLLDTAVDVGCAVLVAFAPVKESRLPRTIDAAFKADLPQLYFVGVNA
jgi:hypothetical protein